MLSFAMACRRIGLLGLVLALLSCSAGGFAEPPRQFSGIWLSEFEGSTFIEGATAIPSERPLDEETDWLEWTERQPRLEALRDEARGIEGCYAIQPIRLTFIGRRTRHPLGGAGHMGLWRSTVTVERTISAEHLGPSFCYERWG